MEWLKNAPIGELTAYAVQLLVFLWVLKTVFSALLSGDIVPAKNVEAWQDIALAEQENSRKLVAQNEQLFASVEALKQLVETVLPRPPGHGEGRG